MIITRLRNLWAIVVCLLVATTAQAQFSKTLELPVSSEKFDTMPVEFSLEAVATALSTDTTTLVAALNAWEPGTDDLFFLADPADPTVLSNDYTQGSKGGFWVLNTGVPAAWNTDGLTWYNTIGWDATADVFAINIGQMPGVAKVGDEYKPHFVLKFGGKEAAFDVTIQFVEPAAPAFELPEITCLIEKDMNVVGETEVKIEQYPRSSYDSNTVKADLTDALAKLGISDAAMVKEMLDKMLFTTLYDTASVTLGHKRDSLTNKATANGIGFWFAAVVNEGGEEYGEVASSAYSSSCKFYTEQFAFNDETNLLTCNLGQYPNSLNADEQWFANFYLVYGDKAYRLRYTLSVVAKPETGGLEDYTKVGEAEVTVQEEPDNNYTAKPIHPDMEAIAAALGCEVADITMEALDDTGAFSEAHTAQNGGFWLNMDGLVVSWGSAAYFFIEPPVANDFSTLNVGQYPNACNVDEEATASLYFVYDKKYFEYKVTLKIIAPQQIDDEFQSVVTRTIAAQTLVTTDYQCTEKYSISMEDLEAQLGTTDVTLYGLATDEAAETLGMPYSKAYSCDPKPGFWLNAAGRVSTWGDSDARVGICYADGVFTFFQYPGRNNVGDVFNTQLFLVNGSGKMITYRISLAFVEEIAHQEEVGHESIAIPVSVADQYVSFDAEAAATALGVTVADLLNEDNNCMRGMTADGVFGIASRAADGLAFKFDGTSDAESGDIFVTIEESAQNEVVLHAWSNEEVAEDFVANAVLCLEAGNKQYVYYVKFLSPKGYAEGIETIGAEASKSGVLYDLSGRRVKQPVRGLYISNNRKFIVK